MSRAVSMGMAKPTPMLPPWDVVPWASEAMAVLMPTTSPSALMSAPPELPGLMAASVWMASMTAVSDGSACGAPPPNGDCWSGVDSPCSVIDAVEGADDAGAHRAVEAEGAADGEHGVADVQVGAAAERGRA